MVNFGEVRRPDVAKSTLLISTLVPLSDAKERERRVKSNGKLAHLSIRSKTTAWVPDFVVEDLPLSRTAALVPEFAVKYLPLGRILYKKIMYQICMFK